MPYAEVLELLLVTTLSAGAIRSGNTVFIMLAFKLAVTAYLPSLLIVYVILPAIATSGLNLFVGLSRVVLFRIVSNLSQDPAQLP